jgi:diguanylate cyclase (GGDEF)-like protein
MTEVKQTSKAQRYATYGALLSLGSPIGWAIIDLSLDLDTGHPYLFYYMVFGTCTSFTVFAYLLGRKMDDIHKLSQTDLMTDLYNQTSFLNIAGKLFDHCLRSNLSCTACLIDIDKFKQVNDKNDHLFGNYVIKYIAEIIRDEVRSSDAASRFGGDEFALLLPDTSAEQAVILIERICQRVSSAPITRGSFEATVTLSVGICDDQSGKDNLEDILRCADKALYKAKKNGRNQYQLHCNP